MSDLVEQSQGEVLAYIEETQQELLAFLREYMHFKSVNPDMLTDNKTSELQQCQQWLEGQLRAWNAFDEIDSLVADLEQPNVVGRRQGTGDGPALLFNGHSDVVPVTDEQAAAWSQGTPWGGEVLDGKVWGRGASDMKGGNAAFLWAIKALADTDVTLQGDLLATVVSGEETGNHTIGVDLLADADYIAPFGVLAEPTGLEVCPASVGEFYFLLRVQGRSASLSNRHLSIYPTSHGTPVPGVNAIDKMWKIQRALADLEHEWGVWQSHALMEPGNMNINFSRIHGGETYSAMAESCELTGSVLFNPSLSFAEVLDEFREAIDGVVQTDYWLREHPPSLTVPYILEEKEPVDISPDHPGCQALARAYRGVRNSKPTFSCTTATSDGNYLFARGQDIITFGPGSPDAGVHGPNEHIKVEALVQATKVYALMTIDWCGVASVR